MQRIYLQGANARLSAVSLGDPTNPAVVAVHGLRDHALGLYELLEPLAEHYYVVALDLRGHGHSDKTHTYTMIQFMADLKALFDHFAFEHARLIGHSLGGHIAMRFAATYPERVSQLVLLDGMGPPGNPDGVSVIDVQARLKEGIQTVLAITGQRRAISNAAEAKARLQKNNPLMSEALAELIVSEGVEPHPDGGVMWRWESAVNMIWQTFSHHETEALIPLIESPVLILTGDRGLDYWVAMRPQQSDESFYEAELLRREALFNSGRHVVIENAGHMLHYDQPLAVYNEVAGFFTAAAS
ncbi:MAG: alpha/beta fold hydrolase [Pseudomonadales bacterium]